MKFSVKVSIHKDDGLVLYHIQEKLNIGTITLDGEDDKVSQ